MGTQVCNFSKLSRSLMSFNFLTFMQLSQPMKSINCSAKINNGHGFQQNFTPTETVQTKRLLMANLFRFIIDLHNFVPYSLAPHTYKPKQAPPNFRMQAALSVTVEALFSCSHLQHLKRLKARNLY